MGRALGAPTGGGRRSPPREAGLWVRHTGGQGGGCPKGGGSGGRPTRETGAEGLQHGRLGWRAPPHGKWGQGAPHTGGWAGAAPHESFQPQVVKASVQPQVRTERRGTACSPCGQSPSADLTARGSSPSGHGAGWRGRCVPSVDGQGKGRSRGRLLCPPTLRLHVPTTRVSGRGCQWGDELRSRPHPPALSPDPRPCRQSWGAGLLSWCKPSG